MMNDPKHETGTGAENKLYICKTDGMHKCAGYKKMEFFQITWINNKIWFRVKKQSL